MEKKGAVECLRAGIKTQYHSETREILGSDISSSVIAFGTSDMQVEDKELEYSWKGECFTHHMV